MKRAARHKTGSIVFDKRRKTWNFLWWEEGKRRSKQIGSANQYPTKASAWNAAKPIQNSLECQTKAVSNAPTVNTLVEQYRIEKMPKRTDTRRFYEVWLRNHILPRWGNCPLTDLQASGRVMVGVSASGTEKQGAYSRCAEHSLGLRGMAR